MSNSIRVGIVGARGIGKHHAKWFAGAGCQVAALYGTTEDTAGAAATLLNSSFGIDAQPFHQWDRFVAEGGFDACSVCSPAESHAANVADLARAGKHILCEKPLVWNWDLSPEEILAESRAAVGAAAQHGVLLGVNAQYPAALEGFARLHQAALGHAPRHRSLDFLMETKGQPRSPHGAAEVWVDLGPHPLAVLDAVAPGQVDWETLRHRDGPHETVVDFEWVAGTERLTAHIECRRTTDGTVRRRLANQDLAAEYEGCTVDGTFAARLRSGEHEWVGKDFMQVSVERFVEAVLTGDENKLLVSGAAALRQQEALTGVWERCWR